MSALLDLKKLLLCFFALNALPLVIYAADSEIESKAPSKNNLLPSDIYLIDKSDALAVKFTEQDFLKSHGFTKNEAFKNAQYNLKASILGTKKERKKIKAICDPKLSGNFLTLDSKSADFGCTYLALQNLAEVKPVKKTGKEKKNFYKAQNIVDIKKWQNSSTWTYREAIKYLDVKTIEDGYRLSKYAQETGCSTAIAASALISQLEDFLPEPRAWEALQSTYERVASCLEATTVANEQLHLRMGLLYILQDRKPAAIDALNRALQARESPEEFRTLFWRGYLDSETIKSDNVSRVRWNPYWQRLITSYPLTQHALLVHELFAEHPMQETQESLKIALSPYKGEAWDTQNLANFIFLNLNSQKDVRTLKAAAEKIAGKIKITNPSPALFTAIMYKNLGFNQESMRLTYAYIRNAGATALTPQAVELLYPVHYLDSIKEHSKDLEVPLVMSLIRQESSFVPHTMSAKGAIGLMQVLESTAKRFSKGLVKTKKSFFIPDNNITVGCRFLSNQLRSFGGNEILTLAAYNAGPRNASKWNDRYKGASPLLYADLIPFSETRAYVSGVLRGRFWYRYLLEGRKDKASFEQNKELVYAEHLLGNKLSANLASRNEPMGEVSLLAKSIMIENDYDESEYNEDF